LKRSLEGLSGETIGTNGTRELQIDEQSTFAKASADKGNIEFQRA
jgi:hypothetical protein